MATRRTRLEPEARRESILAAAREVFVAGDYESASMDAIARRAGVTSGLVNHYFGTKRELYLEVVREMASDLPAMVETDTEDLPLEEMVDRNMINFLDAFERDHEVWSMLLRAQSGVGRDPAVSAVMGGAREQIVSRMARNHAGDDPPPELMLALRSFQGAAEIAASEWIHGRATREEVHDLLARTLIAMVGEHTRK